MHRSMRPLYAVLAVVGLAMSLTGIPAAAARPAVDPALAARLQLAIDRWRENHSVPGLAAAVRMPDGALWIGVSGEAAVGTESRPVRPSTPFVIASITKSFIAALTLQLQEEGVLSLSDPVSKWLPKEPDGDRITLRMLLNHQSGKFDYFAHPRYPSLVFGRPSHHWTVAEILRLRGPAYFAPGQGYRYSNTNYVLLGKILRKATGKSPAVLIRKRFLGPLGMTQTYFQGDEPIGHWPAKGYWLNGSGYTGFSDGSKLRPNTSAATVAWAAGGLVSSVRDVATWQHALLSGDVLKPESLAQMLDFGKYGYGLGMRRQLLAGRMGVGHGGSLRGYEAGMYRLPLEDVSVVVLTNRGLVRLGGITDRLTNLTLKAYAPAPTESVAWGWQPVGAH
jgi:D-alanyl-D-alanine carboxypeptidase